MLQKERWLKGPTFLWKSESEWPASVEVPKLSEDDPEVRQGATVYTTATSERILESLVQRYSTWWGLVRAFAWLSRFKDYLRMKVSNKNSEFRVAGKTKLKVGKLKVDELKTAERNVVGYVQHTSFPEIITALQEGGSNAGNGHIKRNLQNIGSSLYQLNPTLQDGLIIEW